MSIFLSLLIWLRGNLFLTYLYILISLLGIVNGKGGGGGHGGGGRGGGGKSGGSHGSPHSGGSSTVITGSGLHRHCYDQNTYAFPLRVRLKPNALSIFFPSKLPVKCPANVGVIVGIVIGSLVGAVSEYLCILVLQTMGLDYASPWIYYAVLLQPLLFSQGHTQTYLYSAPRKSCERFGNAGYEVEE
jgi:hypothetical protein